MTLEKSPAKIIFLKIWEPWFPKLLCGDRTLALVLTNRGGSIVCDPAALSPQVDFVQILHTARGMVFPRYLKEVGEI